MFALSNSGYQDSDFVIIGVPFDKTSSFRAGTAEGPEKIREESYCFEPYLMEHDIDLTERAVHDMGDLRGIEESEMEGTEEMDNVPAVGDKVEEKVSRIIGDGKFPILIGGEHSISPYSVTSISSSSTFPDLQVIVLDAHLDYRDRYEGYSRSHATTVRRMDEVEGVKEVLVMGVRSYSKKESKMDRPKFFSSLEVKDSWDQIAGQLEEWIDGPVYLSIDMDVFDPSYAPGVGNPEPFGIEPGYARSLIQNISEELVGIDIVETCPPYDDGGITSNLAARFIYEVIGLG